MQETHYRLRWNRIATALMTVFWAAIWLVLALASHVGWLVVALLGVCLLGIAIWANVVAVTAGVYEGADEVVIRSMLGTRTRVKWNEVEAFEHERRGTHDYVYLRLTDGSRRRLLNMLQGQTVMWSDGQTRDIVGRLNERLAARAS
jgi:hypothetical protein